MIRILSLTALATALAATTVLAQGAVNDALFTAAAADSGVAELSLSELGLQRATDPELKKFSQQMIDDHSRVNQELTTLAAQKRIPLPATVDVRAAVLRTEPRRPLGREVRPVLRQGPTGRPHGGGRGLRGRGREGPGPRHQGVRRQDPAASQGSSDDDQAHRHEVREGKVRHLGFPFRWEIGRLAGGHSPPMIGRNSSSAAAASPGRGGGGLREAAITSVSLRPLPRGWRWPTLRRWVGGRWSRAPSR